MAAWGKKKVSPAAYFRALEKKGPGEVYAVDGVDVLVDAFVTAVRAKVFPPGAPGVDFNLDRFVGADVRLAKVLDHAQTLPAFAPRRLVIVQQAEPLLDKASADDENALLAYLERPSPTTTLLLVAASKFDGRRKLYKAIQSGGAAVRFEPPQEAEMPGAVRERAAVLGVEIEPDAAEALAHRVGTDLGEMYQALERVALFVGPRPLRPLTRADVEAVVAGVREEDAFEVVEAIGRGDRAAVLRGLHRVLSDQREPAVKFLGALTWHYRNLLRAREALDRGVGEGDMYGAVRVPRPRLPGLLRVARQGSVGGYARALSAIAEVDRALKGGTLDDQRALERLALELRAEARGLARGSELG